MSFIILWLPFVLLPSSYKNYRDHWVKPFPPFTWVSDLLGSQIKAYAISAPSASSNTHYEIELLAFSFPQANIKKREPTKEELKLEEYKKTMPPRYIPACVGDEVEALRRWKATCEWRDKEGIDTILDEPQPFFSAIKRNYPHFYCGRGKSGNAVYYEYCYKVDIPKLRAVNCNVDDMIRHYLFMSEFAFTKLSPKDTDKTITVFDMKGVGVGDLRGEVM